MHKKPVFYNLNAVITIAFRDFAKFIRDPRRLIFSFVFPFIFVVILGQSFNSSLGENLPLDYEIFILTGILGQTLFQSAAGGIISLVQDREEDFAQELFIAPVPRVVILLGKILGESLVAAVQGVGVLTLGIFTGVTFTLVQVVALIPLFIVATFLGASFGVLVLANLNEPRAANQIFPLLLLPQFFLSGAFSPFTGEGIPVFLKVLHHITPMTYAIDFGRNILYPGDKITDLYYQPDVIGPVTSLSINILIIAIMFSLFLGLGTFLFVRNERNK